MAAAVCLFLHVYLCDSVRHNWHIVSLSLHSNMKSLQRAGWPLSGEVDVDLVTNHHHPATQLQVVLGSTSRPSLLDFLALAHVKQAGGGAKSKPSSRVGGEGKAASSRQQSKAPPFLCFSSISPTGRGIKSGDLEARVPSRAVEGPSSHRLGGIRHRERRFGWLVQLPVVCGLQSYRRQGRSLVKRPSSLAKNARVQIGGPELHSFVKHWWSLAPFPLSPPFFFPFGYTDQQFCSNIHHYLVCSFFGPDASTNGWPYASSVSSEQR